MHRVIAIDGPAASGKSSTARAVANALGWVHLDSGALYRAAALVALELDEANRSPREIAVAAERGSVALERQGDRFVVRVSGRDAEAEIRTPRVTALVSVVAAMPELRTWITERLREAILREAGTGVVVDGRDIGTAVFPEAPVKIFLTAEPRQRALRRLQQQGDSVEPEALQAETLRLQERDGRDAARAHAPLKKANDATVVDTTALGFDEQVGRILAVARGVFSR